MKIEMIGLPLDLGANRRGVDMAPSAIRIAGITERLEKIGHEIKDDGDLEVFVPEVLKIENPKLKYLPEIEKSVTHLADEVSRTLEDGRFPLVLGGDHSIAVGSISGAARFLKSKKQKTRSHLDRCAWRYEHPRNDFKRQHSRHVLRGCPWRRSSGTRERWRSISKSTPGGRSARWRS